MTEASSDGWSPSDPNSVREQLARILKSGPFQQSQRRQRFLQYLVNETLTSGPATSAAPGYLGNPTAVICCSWHQSGSRYTATISSEVSPHEASR